MRRLLAAFLALCLPLSAFAASVEQTAAPRITPAPRIGLVPGLALPALGQETIPNVELGAVGARLETLSAAQTASASVDARSAAAFRVSAAVAPEQAAVAARAAGASAAPPSQAAASRPVAGREFQRSFSPDGRYALVAKAWDKPREDEPVSVVAGRSSLGTRVGRFALRAAPVALALALPALAHAAPAAAAAHAAVPGVLGTLGLGFWLGVKHASDADHVAAVSTIVARTRRLGTSWLLGAFWGIGHSATILAVGAAIIVAKVVIPPHLGLAMEFAVGLVLIALGAMNMAGKGLGSFGVAEHVHPHAETSRGWFARHLRDAGSFQLARSLFVGLVHGLAGSAAVALLVLATIREPAAAVVYLGIFGVGTLVGMLGMSAMMELAMFKLGRKWSPNQRAIAFITGLLSLAFGLWVAWHIGFIDGLFSANPRWTPS